MSYTFWTGGYNVADLKWLSQAITDLRSNAWSTEKPLLFDGAAWSLDAVREKATVALLSALRQNTTVDKLIVSNTDMELKASQALTDVFDHNTTLRKISLKQLRCDSQPMVLSPSMFQNTSLEELNLEACTLPKDSCIAMRRMLLHSEEFRSLSLENVSMASYNWLSALKTSKSLESLTLRHMALNEKELTKLLACLAVNTSLVSVKLEQMNLSEKHVASLARILSKNQHIQELSLCKNNLSDSRFLGHLKRNTTLQTLDISHNPVGDHGVRHIVNALHHNGTLETLRLRSCGIGEAGVETIARSIPNFRGLQYLSLDGNSLPAPCTLRASLQKNVVLRHVLDDLPSFLKGVGEADWRHVDFLLRLNKANRSYLGTVDTSNGACLQPFLRQAAEQGTDVLFYFCQHLPSAICRNSSVTASVPSISCALPIDDLDSMDVEADAPETNDIL